MKSFVTDRTTVHNMAAMVPQRRLMTRVGNTQPNMKKGARDTSGGNRVLSVTPAVMTKTEVKMVIRCAENSSDKEAGFAADPVRRFKTYFLIQA